jgi:diguanylate cyclase (GGDEF)-like protein
MEWVDHELVGYHNPDRQSMHMFCSYHGPKRRQAIQLAREVLTPVDGVPPPSRADGFHVHRWVFDAPDCYGLLTLLRRGRALSEQDLEFIDESLLILAEPLKRALEYENIFAQARRDALTGLPNRFVFEERIHALVEQARRHGRPLTLAALDLDHFKAVNDTAGHAAGDALLRTVADLIRQRLRAEDIVCRIGGDEFAMILRGCTSADASRIADGLCEAVRELRFMWEGREFRIGASIGFAIIDGTMESVAEVLHAADHACYAVKREGRGRVMEYVPEPPASSAG